MKGLISLKAAIWKELRQNAGWSALGMLNAAAVLYFSLESGSDDPRTVVEAVFMATLIVMPLVGLMIGLVQVLPESRGDAWAFLTHRPVHRSTLFFAKAIAGLILYIAATGIPLAFALDRMANLGRLYMVFDRGMAMPGIADMLCGMAYYFAGFLIGMRDARWSGSRLAGLGLPLLCSVVMLLVPQFWQAILVGLIGTLVTAAAARGAFVGGGKFQSQSLVARFATGITVATGIGIAGLAAVSVTLMFLVTSRPQPPSESRQIHYDLTGSGEIVTITTQDGVTRVEDLQGRPIQGYQPPSPQVTRKVIEAAVPLQTEYWDTSYRSPNRYFIELVRNSSSSPVSWYYLQRLRLIAAYDNSSWDLMGWWGPDGFSPGKTLPVRRFEANPRLRLIWGNPFVAGIPLLAFEESVYQLDLTFKKIEKIFTVRPGEAVTGASGSAYFNVIGTTERVVVQSPNGDLQLEQPWDANVAEYVEVKVLRPSQSTTPATFFWFYPDYLDPLSPSPQYVVRMGADGAKSEYTMPTLFSMTTPDAERVILPWLVTPVSVPVAFSLKDGTFNWRFPNRQLGHSGIVDDYGFWVVRRSDVYSTSQLTVVWILSAMASIFPAALAFTRGRAYAFPRRQLWTWTMLSFLLGPLGFLLMLSLIEWPARESCAACGRSRIVTRERCEHCGAPFPPPPADGTEIFEPA